MLAVGSLGTKGTILLKKVCMSYSVSLTGAFSSFIRKKEKELICACCKSYEISEAKNEVSIINMRIEEGTLR